MFKYANNHSGVDDHLDRVYDQLRQDVFHRRSVLFTQQFLRDIRIFRVSPLGVVLEPKLDIVHDLTFAPRASVRTTVNHDTHFVQAPPCEIGNVLSKVLRQVVYLRQKYGPAFRIVLTKIDTKEAFR